MKKIICVCNTYFQLLTAIQLRLTLFKKDEVSVVLSNHSNNSEEVLYNLSTTNLFDRCYYVKTKAAYNTDNFVKRNAKLIEFYVKGNDPIWANLELGAQDEMVYYNQINEIYTLFAYLYEKNKEIKVSKYEEGIFSYDNNLFPKQRVFITNVMRKVLKKKNLDKMYHNYYCFYPELYKGELRVVKIPEIKSDGQLKELLSNVFGVNLSEIVYKTKYIYFSSVYDFEGGKPIGELELVKQIADLVGKDNLLVKVHPRDDLKKYEDEGLEVDKNSNIPWEVIQLGNDFSNCIFITANSGSVLSISLLQEKSPKVYFMYKLCDVSKNPRAIEMIEKIEKIVNGRFIKDKKMTIDIVEDINDILG